MSWIQKENLPNNKIQGRYYKYGIIKQWMRLISAVTNAALQCPVHLLSNWYLCWYLPLRKEQIKDNSSIKYIKLRDVSFKCSGRAEAVVNLHEQHPAGHEGAGEMAASFISELQPAQEAQSPTGWAAESFLPTGRKQLLRPICALFHLVS